MIMANFTWFLISFAYLSSSLAFSSAFNLVTLSTRCFKWEKHYWINKLKSGEDLAAISVSPCTHIDFNEM